MFIPTPLLCFLRTEQTVKFFSLFLIKLQYLKQKKTPLKQQSLFCPSAREFSPCCLQKALILWQCPSF